MWRASLIVIALCGSAHAQRRGYIDGFIGWSKDHTFFAMTTSGTDEMNVPLLCLAKPGTPSPTWPKGVPLPDKDDPDGCTDRWDMMFPESTDDAETLVAKVTAMVEPRAPAKKGPGGETVTVKRHKGAIIEASVKRGGKVVARSYFELKFDDAAVPSLVQSYWLPDGSGVAIVAGYKPDPRAIGYGPPQFTTVIPLDGTSIATAPLNKRQRAQALNVEGMKFLTAKKYDQAQEKFQAAVQEDDELVVASYNLACAASLRKDKSTAIRALQHLAASSDPAAKKALSKGLTDHDLDWIGTDPEGAKLLDRSSK